ncbi:nuclear transport factor 2 family protein [Frateuria defendens]|uniref:nuclear transport factor 2 family protein n=1 Tax=Frateuria defendens TaxID=2219559 RepID=UPI00066FF50C|nr:nuclear transport factor 2 family protein [Frateuria defendens]
MSKADNIALARRLYDSGAAPDVTREILAPDLVWDITPGFPRGGVYHGYDSTMKDFFGQFVPLFASWSTQAQAFYGDDENHVFVTGQYHGVTKSGKKADVRFIHLWTVRDGKLAALEQVADSHLVQQALAADGSGAALLP